MTDKSTRNLIQYFDISSELTGVVIPEAQTTRYSDFYFHEIERLFVLRTIFNEDEDFVDNFFQGDIAIFFEQADSFLLATIIKDKAKSVSQELNVKAVFLGIGSSDEPTQVIIVVYYDEINKRLMMKDSGLRINKIPFAIAFDEAGSDQILKIINSINV